MAATAPPDPQLAGPDPLLDALRACVVRIDVGDAFAGTGFLVTPDEILTCAHVVRKADAVRVQGDGWEAEGEVVTRLPELADDDPRASFHPLPDIALVRLPNPPPGLPCVRLGVDGPTADPPDMMRLDAFAKGEHGPNVVGRSPATVAYEGPVQEEGHTLFKLAGGQVLHGFSGCPLLNLRTGDVCAVVDSSRDPKSDLGGFGVPLAGFADILDGLLERNRTHHADDPFWDTAFRAQQANRAARNGDRDRLPLIPPGVELVWTPTAPQSDLLRPRYRVVPLVGREELLAQLGRWRDTDDGLAVTFLTGGGGMGKTRLAVELCETARDAGWTVGLLTGDLSEDMGPRLVGLAEWPERLFVAVDYAEARPDVVHRLLQELVRRPGRPAVRLVLICRQAMPRPALDRLFGSGDAREEIMPVLRRAEPVRLGEEPVARHELFHRAAARYAALLKRDVPTLASTTLRAPHLERPLFLTAAALLACQDPTIDVDRLTEDELMLMVIDEHESAYWAVWDKRLDVRLDAADRATAAAISTLLTAENEREALAVVGLIPGPGDASGERKRLIARWLSSLYAAGRLDATPVIAPLEPDPLAEALIARELQARPELLATALDVASEHQLARALTVLSRASESRPGLASAVRDVLDDRLPALVTRTLDHHQVLLGPLLQAIHTLAPSAGAAGSPKDLVAEHGGVFAPLALALGDLTIAYLRAEIDVEANRPGLAASLNNQASLLSEVGRPEDGLAPIDEAVEHYRTLAAQHPEGFLADLAGSLNNQAGLLSEVGRPEDGLAAIDEAVEHYRTLAAQAPERFLPELAMALNNQASLLSEVGRPEDGLAPIDEAVEHYRTLAAQHPEGFLADLAMALNNQAGLLSEVGRPEDGLAPIDEAVDLRRALAAEQSERFRPDLAMSLNNRSGLLSEVGRPEDGLAAIDEAVEHYRALAAESPERFLPYLAGSLNNQSSLLSGVGRPHDGLAPIDEAVHLRRALAERYPERFLPDLATSLNNQANRLSEVGRPEDALTAIDEAVHLRRALAERYPERFLPYLAGSLNNQANRLSEVGRPEDALTAIDEAVEHYRALNAESPERFLPYLAGSLNNQANRLSGVGRPEDALTASDEAVDRYRALTAQSPERFLPDLAMALNNQANLRSEVGRPEDALAPIDEAVGHYRALTAQHPERFLPDLATALNSQASLLADVGRSADGLTAIDAVLHTLDDDPSVGRILHVRAAHHHENGDLALGVVDAWKAVQLLDGELREPWARGSARALLRRMRFAAPVPFDTAWNDHVADPRPLWLQHPHVDTATGSAVVGWINTPDWRDSQTHLDEHATTLLTDAGSAMLEHLLDRFPGQAATLLPHIRLLARCREVGVETAYDEFLEFRLREALAEGLSSWLRLPTEAAVEALRDHDELRSEAAEAMLGQAVEARPGPLIIGRLGLLESARRDGVDALSTPPPAPPTLAAALDDVSPRALSAARLRVAAAPHDPQVLIQHALLSGASGHQREAAFTAARGAGEAATWERTELRGQLAALAAARPEHADPIVAVIDALTEPAPSPDDGTASP